MVTCQESWLSAADHPMESSSFKEFSKGYAEEQQDEFQPLDHAWGLDAANARIQSRPLFPFLGFRHVVPT